MEETHMLVDPDKLREERDLTAHGRECCREGGLGCIHPDRLLYARFTFEPGCKFIVVANGIDGNWEGGIKAAGQHGSKDMLPISSAVFHSRSPKDADDLVRTEGVILPALRDGQEISAHFRFDMSGAMPVLYVRDTKEPEFGQFALSGENPPHAESRQENPAEILQKTDCDNRTRQLELDL